MNTESRTPEQEESYTFSLEDRERLDLLFDSIGDTHLGGIGGSTQRMEEQLKKEGILAARYLLEKIAENDQRYSFYRRVQQLTFCASWEVAKEIGELLLKDEVTEGLDRSCRINLLNTLQKIGSFFEVHFVVEFCRKIEFSGSLNMDTTDAIDVLSDIGNRLSNGLETKRAIEEINNIRRRNGFEEYDPNFPTQNEAGPEDTESEPFSEETADRQIRGEYFGRAEMMSAVDRLEVVKKLRELAHKEKDPDYLPEDPDRFLRRQLLEYNETNPSPYGVTMGTEIEVPKESIMSEDDLKNWDNLTYGEEKAIKDKYLGKFNKTAKFIPKEDDKLWEFAHHPARNSLTLSREVQALMEMGLINSKYQMYPLHLTLGGVSPGFKKGEHAHLLSHILEATGWCSSGVRLSIPYTKKAGCGWTARGIAGVRERGEKDRGWRGGDDMQAVPELGISSRGTEFRTLQFRSLSGLDRLLHSAYYLGAALRAFQEKAEGEKENDPVSNELSDVWEEFSEKCTELFVGSGLSDPKTIWHVGFAETLFWTPEVTYVKGEFIELANILNNAESDPGGPESEFVHNIRLLIIQTRTKVKEILEKERSERLNKQ